MNHTPIYNYFVFNGKIKPTSQFVPSENVGGIYEVVRVIDGIPLFADAHLERFYHSASLAGKTIRFSAGSIKHMIKRLIGKNKVSEGNILISYKTNLKAFFIAHKYPHSGWYTKGVCCGFLHAERHNPNAKVFQTDVRRQADNLIENEGFYEVLLVDHFKRVTEGSRSNVFFVKGNAVFTPPANEVLLGVTRQKTIELVKKAGVEFREKEVFMKEMARFDALFLTGTSPKILPVREAGKWNFDPQNILVQTLVQKYDELILTYIRGKKTV